MSPEQIHRAPLGLTYDEEDVLHDLLGTTPEDDEDTLAPYRNALSTLRMKAGLHYSATRGVDVGAATAAVERIADHARDNGLELRLHYDHDAMAYVLRVGVQMWTWECLYTLLPRVARELGVARERTGTVA
jgi:hypothetical protein